MDKDWEEYRQIALIIKSFMITIAFFGVLIFVFSFFGKKEDK